MIQVLLLILKIIGISILVLLGLLLLILTLVLFVPVFYRVRVIHNPEKTQVKARVSFLFPLLLVTFEYLKKISYKVRIFGFALLDSDKPKKEKQPKEKKPKKKKEKKSKKKPQVIQEEEDEEEDIWVPLEHPGTLPAAEPEPVEEINTEPTPKPQQEQKEEKIGFFEKIRSKIQKIRETIRRVIDKIKKLLRQKDEVQRILTKPETKQAIAFAWKELKHLLKHILPRKIKGYVAYGADNPATTGQVLGIVSVVYAKTGKLLTIRPNFTEKQLECDVELKGHIQVFVLLVIAVKVVLNKELRKLITEFKNVKEIE